MGDSLVTSEDIARYLISERNQTIELEPSRIILLESVIDTDPALVPRTWWNVVRDDDEKVLSYKGFEIGMKLLREESEKVGGFDGVIGFR